MNRVPCDERSKMPQKYFVKKAAGGEIVNPDLLSNTWLYLTLGFLHHRVFTHKRRKTTVVYRIFGQISLNP